MSQTKYLIVGSSHAGLSALEAIRAQDREGSITLLTQEKYLPYSPTILPYVVSGLVEAANTYLRDEEALNRNGVNFKRGAKVIRVEPEARTVSLETGETLGYENLLLATGAKPALPPIAGLKGAPYHVLRTLDDALGLQSAAQKASSAIVLGGGLIGMHAAENMAKRGRQVTVVEAMPQILPGYFDTQAAGLVQRVFSEQGIKTLTGSAVTRVSASNGGCVVSLDSGPDLSADLLLVATGVSPCTEYLAESGIEVHEGILVDDTMRASASHVWAAGDVAQARGFFNSEKRINATIPNAVEQGRIAGMDMVDDPAVSPFPGGLAMNAYRFLGNQAFSVGLNVVPDSDESYEVDKVFHPTSLQYQKLIFKEGRLVGASGINSNLDPGIMAQLIGRRVELGEVKAQLVSAPLETGRILMSRLWR
jgi:phenylglyoxylate dehydrogenase epsilon subunit